MSQDILDMSPDDPRRPKKEFNDEASRVSKTEEDLKAQLEWLLDQKAEHNAEMHYTPDNEIEQIVDTRIDNAIIGSINQVTAKQREIKETLRETWEESRNGNDDSENRGRKI